MVPSPNRHEGGPPHSAPRARCLRWGGLPLLWLLVTSRGAAQDLRAGIDSWAETISELSAPKWTGPRVPFPESQPRPKAIGSLSSFQAPLRVHAGRGTDPHRLGAVLEQAEATLALLAQTGILDLPVDAGGGGSFERDLYLVADANQAADAQIDASQTTGALDGAHAFALVDARLPADRLWACTAHALIEARLFELDPAESSRVRKASAGYFAELVAGEPCMAEGREGPARDQGGSTAPLGVDPLLGWLEALSARQDQNRGVFLAMMWQFCRQHTWEGDGLRASPHLLEAIEHALGFSHESLDQIAPELARQEAQSQMKRGQDELWPTLDAARFPARLPPFSPPLDALETRHLLVELSSPKPGAHLSIWSRGEYGVRWALSATLLDEDDQPQRVVSAPVRKLPKSELHIDLGPKATRVLVSLTNLGDGTPQLLPEDETFLRTAQLTFALTP